jgi:hypothetical protein
MLFPECERPDFIPIQSNFIPIQSNREIYGLIYFILHLFRYEMGKQKIVGGVIAIVPRM